jgi:hypothetical protein
VASLERLRLRFWLGAMDAIERVEDVTEFTLSRVWLFAMARARASAGWATSSKERHV